MCTLMTDHAQVFRWLALFQEGRKSLEDDPRPGRPVSAWSYENVGKPRGIVMQNRRISTKLVAEGLGVGNEANRKIMERCWQKRKIHSRFVPHFLIAPDKNKTSEDKKNPVLDTFKTFCIDRYKNF
jgi:hypothetical protein